MQRAGDGFYTFFLKGNQGFDYEFTSNVLSEKPLERCLRNILSTNSAYILKKIKCVSIITLAEEQ